MNDSHCAIGTKAGRKRLVLPVVLFAFVGTYIHGSPAVSAPVQQIGAITGQSFGGTHNPDILTVVVDGIGNVKLIWDPIASNTNELLIERWTGNTGWADYATVSTEATTFTDTNVEPRLTYCYRISELVGGKAFPLYSTRCTVVPTEAEFESLASDDSDGKLWEACLVHCASPNPGRAFPSAEGLAAFTPGGRNGIIVYVTNLLDYDELSNEPVITGSLRWAIEALSGPRIVMFKVGGTIALKHQLVFRGSAGSFVTVAGQSAPGDGIQLKGFGLTIRDGAHDVIIRYLRVRPGYTSDDDWNTDALTIWGNNGKTVYNVIADHCSFQWAIDECVTLWDDVRRVTLQRNIIGEGSLFGHHSKDDDPNVPADYPHSYAMLTGGANSKNVDDYLTLHHNLIIHNDGRNPQFTDNGGLSHVVNNVIYNWRSRGMTIKMGIGLTASPRVNVVGNHFIRGPNSSTTRRAVGVRNLDDGSLFLSDNLSPFRTDDSMSDWEPVAKAYGTPSTVLPEDEIKRRFTAWPVTVGVSVTTESSSTVLASVSSDCGANRPRLDAVDQRLLAELATGTGETGFGSSVMSHYPHPTLNSGPIPIDTDSDGMPDTWESSQGLDPTNPADGVQDPDGDGYSNVEEYLNDLVGEE